MIEYINKQEIVFLVYLLTKEKIDRDPSYGELDDFYRNPVNREVKTLDDWIMRYASDSIKHLEWEGKETRITWEEWGGKNLYLVESCDDWE